MHAGRPGGSVSCPRSHPSTPGDNNAMTVHGPKVKVTEAPWVGGGTAALRHHRRQVDTLGQQTLIPVRLCFAHTSRALWRIGCAKSPRSLRHMTVTEVD